jgi:hypothetical protein
MVGGGVDLDAVPTGLLQTGRTRGEAAISSSISSMVRACGGSSSCTSKGEYMVTADAATRLAKSA